MAILLAAAASIGWGASDYFGGDASRHATPVLVVLAVGELLGAALLVPALMARGAPPPLGGRLLPAAVAGLAVTAELSIIYRALSRGQAFIGAPTGALGTAMAVVAGLIGGDPLDVTVAVGLVLALIGGGVSAWTASAADPQGAEVEPTGSGRALLSALAAAVAVGTMLTCLHAAGRLDPLWATFTEHTSTGLSAGAAALVSGRRRLRGLVPERRLLPTLGLIGTVGVGGDLAYASASHRGALSIVSAIASLYPVTTIVLGRLLRGQRATRVQLLGAILALAGAAMLGAGAP